MSKKQLPEPAPGITWTYWVSRDSLDDALMGKCSLWYAKPLRVKHRGRVTWIGADPRFPCHLGDFKPEEVAGWFGTYPETNMELIRVEQTPTQAMLDKAAKTSA